MNQKNIQIEFLLKEYDQSWQHYRHAEKERQTYFNIYIILFTAFLGVFFSFPAIIEIAKGIFSLLKININIPNSDLNIDIYFLIFLILFYIFYGTKLIYIEIKLRYECITYMWQINSIRKFFLERNNELKDYLQFEVIEGPEILPGLKYKKKGKKLPKGLYTMGTISLNIITFLNSILITILITYTANYILNIDLIKSFLINFLGNYLFLLLYYISLFIIAITTFFISLFSYKKMVENNLLLKSGNFNKKLEKLKKDYKYVINKFRG